MRHYIYTQNVFRKQIFQIPRNLIAKNNNRKQHQSVPSVLFCVLQNIIPTSRTVFRVLGALGWPSKATHNQTHSIHTHTHILPAKLILYIYFFHDLQIKGLAWLALSNVSCAVRFSWMYASKAVFFVVYFIMLVVCRDSGRLSTRHKRKYKEPNKQNDDIWVGLL